MHQPRMPALEHLESRDVAELHRVGRSALVLLKYQLLVHCRDHPALDGGWRLDLVANIHAGRERRRALGAHTCEWYQCKRQHQCRNLHHGWHGRSPEGGGGWGGWPHGDDDYTTFKVSSRI